MHQTCRFKHPNSQNFIRGNPLLRRLVMWFLVVVTVTIASSFLLAGQSTDAASQASPPAQAPEQKGAPDPNQQKQSIPDAPSTVQPPTALPQPPPTPQSEQQSAPAPQTPAANEPPPRESSDEPPAGPRPPINIRTVPQGGATTDGADASTQEELFTIRTNVNQVILPVTVKDESGHLVGGLLSKDFTVRENGKKQTLNFFTSDPFALSAAIIFDLGMKDVDVQKVNHTFPALEGVFSPFDE